jgi:hypothetical protein
LTTVKRVISFAAALLLIAASVSYSFYPVMATPGVGAFALDLSGTTLNGNLENAIVKSDSVSMNMILNGNIPTSLGQVPVTANGIWTGNRNGTSLTGTIQNVSGIVNMCILFWCGTATFIGQGEWKGNLTVTEGTGVFEGTITFTSSDFSQIHTNQPAPISGTWNADFQVT